MSERRSLFAGPVLPAVVCLGLAAMLYLQVVRPPELASVPTMPAAGEATVADPTVLDPFVLPGVAAFSEIVERPVFSPTRRPPTASDAEEPEAVEAAPSRPQDLDVTVVGIITGPRELALLKSDSDDRVVAVAEGEDLSGWTLTDIEPFRLVFRRGGEEQVVEIEYRDD